ncbi:DNA-directed RNA polymerase [Telmatospirillum sp. J64-1]|uniref:DNA-directed RNA polymerase n=1 Tax=Telmatospirillum sp. J64-1 TaxID=2502183 RepID=UPI00115E2E59|nr:DNA-directed RNA polymerase [Telmatospirillum sp. J64-1]
MGKYENPLMDTQICLEEEMMIAGREAFYRLIDEAKARGEESSTGYGQWLLKCLVLPMSQAIESFVGRASTGKAGKHHSSVKYMKLLDPEVISYLTLKTVLDSITKQETRQRAAIRIATAIEDEVWFQKFRAKENEKFKITEKKIAGSSRERSKVIMRLMANRAGIAHDNWPQKDKLHLGQKLLDILRSSTGLIDYTRHTIGPRNTVYYVVASEQTMAQIANVNERMEILTPHLWPTVVPPKRWTTPFNGGYWSGLVRRLPLVKTGNSNYLEELQHLPMDEVYRAINTMQETPWRINRRLLAVLREAWDRGLQIGKLPPQEAIPEPAKPLCLLREGALLTQWRKEKNTQAVEAWMQRHGTEFKAWKKEAALVHQINTKLKSKRIQVRKTIEMAEKFAVYERIYFPHQMDFRGRAYAVPMFLNPQGPDYAKALLTFADGKPIKDAAAAGWLAIHGANLFGFDKACLEDRIGWVDENEDAILTSALDPLGVGLDFWTKADKPWQFLAFCMEWQAFQEHGWGYVSSLPIALDGSCNGLQHYSAALRDPVGGAAVNLLPSELPQDIYARVAEVVVDELRLNHPRTGTESDMAQKWLAFGVDRKITKRSVMTLPYGSTQFSCREFIEEAIREKLDDKARIASVERGIPYKEAWNEANPFRTVRWIEDHPQEADGIFEASLFLQPIVWEAIGKVVKAARIGMDWLKECARLAATEGLPINWITPDGFLVQQAYKETKATRVKTILDGEVVYLTLQEELPTIDKRRQAQGIAPNWVHSMDATALRMYVNLARDNGIRHFALVHDSYGTVAADVELMGACLRKAFVQLYTESDPLAEFRVDVASMLGDDLLEQLPQLPDKGDLDVTLVEESAFFFA